ncbi:MAG: cell division protein FtsQ/DivIB [Solirubrobacterales bacterium]
MSRSRAATAAGKRRSRASATRSARSSKRPASARSAARRTQPRRQRAPRRPRARRFAARSVLRRRGPRSWRGRLAVLGVLGVALAAGYLFWLRDSSLVAVDDVEVVGVTAGEREQIVAELTASAEHMTTLHVDSDRIERVASDYPTIGSVEVDANFPHGMRIEVAERPPTLLVRGGGRDVAAAADGTLLAGVPVAEDELPVLEVDEVPGSGTLGGEPLEQALIVGAIPEPLRPLIEKIDYTDDYGVEITLRGAIPVRFGSGSGAEEKWAAAATVLADPKLDALTYVDVRVPERPAAGGAAKPPQSADPPA